MTRVAPRLSRFGPAALGRRPASRFFGTLTRSVPGLASAWWLLLVVRSLVPAALAVTASAKLVTKATGVSGEASVGSLVASVGQTPWPGHEAVNLAFDLERARLALVAAVVDLRRAGAPIPAEVTACLVILAGYVQGLQGWAEDL